MKGRRYLFLIFISLFIIFVDQIIKIYIHTQFDLHQSITVIQDFFSITYVRNTGAAFGIFADYSETFRNMFFLSIPPIAVGIILYFMYEVPEDDYIQIFALSFICGGALGNYIDRLRFGYVVDFLDFHYKDVYTFPAFNVADSAIVCGVGVLLLILLKEIKEEQLAKQKLKSGK